ncbi:MAG: InlB B-repeat-containing protein, partial [Clostridia bacterium]|nr:InlB B-repeat-containing protein [Clostridia bacterium]
YNVTFDYNDGRIESKTIKVVHGEEIPLEEFPQEDNGKKVLIAWSISTNSIIEFSGAVTQDIRLYAFYKNYKVFNFYDGINDEPIEVNVFQNEPYTPEALENRDGYTFKGWYSDELFRGDPVQSVSYGGLYKDFYANWAVNTYSLEFVTNGGIYLGGNVSYTIESDSFDLPTPTKANYTFVGWCKNEDLSDEPITAIEKGTFGLTKLYAKYKGEDKTLILDAGAGNVNPTSLVVEYGASYTLPVPTLSEHVFMGWYDGTQTSANKITNENGVSLSALQVDELETTLYAHYMEKLYITTSVNIEEAGNVSVKDYYLEGDLVTLKATCNAGYTFIGYYENGNLVCDQLTYEFTMGASYLTYELVYEANKYTVTLVPGNGATCDETIVEVEFGSIYTLPVPTKPAYTFIGWKLNSNFITDNNGLSLAPWNKTSNVTLYANFVAEDPDSSLVYNATSFLEIKDDPSGTYSLVAEIDMTGVTWEPFDFSGTIKGNGMVIKNLTITSSSGNLGMFKKFSGTMQNVVFENLNVTSTSYNSVYVGGICAEMTGGTL